MTTTKSVSNWAMKKTMDIGEKIFLDKELKIICAVCFEKISKENMSGFSFCKSCPSDQGLTCYCSDCKSICRKRHKKLDHEVNFVSVNDKKILKETAVVLRSKYNEVSVKTQSKSFQTAYKVSFQVGLSVSLATHGVQKVCEHWTVLVAVGSKAAIKLSTQSAKEVLKGALYGTAGFQAMFCAVEVTYITSLWVLGAISGKELARRVGKSVVTNAAAFGGCAAGVKIGAAIGMLGGPLGILIGGIVGAIVGGTAGHVISENLFDSYWKPDETEDEIARRTSIKNALGFFNIDEKHITDPEKFNENKLTQLYREFAKIYHPDRKTGSNQEFIALAQHFGVLLAVLDIKGKDKTTNHKNQKKERQQQKQITHN